MTIMTAEQATKMKKMIMHLNHIGIGIAIVMRMILNMIGEAIGIESDRRINDITKMNAQQSVVNMIWPMNDDHIRMDENRWIHRPLNINTMNDWDMVQTVSVLQRFPSSPIFQIHPHFFILYHFSNFSIYPFASSG